MNTPSDRRVVWDAVGIGALLLALVGTACDSGTSPPKTQAPPKATKSGDPDKDPGEGPGAGEASDQTPRDATPGQTARATGDGGPVPTRPTRYDDAPVVAAIGDVHGDLAATRAALRLAGAIDETDAWVGGSLVVVQTGDQLDRGDDEQAILDLLERLEDEATAAGGALHVLNGNHEIMNVAGDLRYVTPGGFADFEDAPGVEVGTADPRVARAEARARARVAAFVPGGPYARKLARRNTVVIVGETVFVHGGVLPDHVSGGVPDLEKLNADAREWFWGGSTRAKAIVGTLMNPQSVVWTRVYADGDPDTCETLRTALQKLNASRMVVGHTVQKEGITSACDGHLWRIDVGMAHHYGGSPQVLRIEGDAVRVVGG